MPPLIGYARISEWEERLLEEDPEEARGRFAIQSIAEQVALILRRGAKLHPELPTDTAPAGIGPVAVGSPSGVRRPGLTRVRELLGNTPGSALIVTDVDRLALRVRDVEWLLAADSRHREVLGTPPPILALNSWLSTVPGDDPAAGPDFLGGAAAERRARRARVALSDRPSSASRFSSTPFIAGAAWEAYAPARRARDADEERRLVGRPAARPAIADDAALVQRLHDMRGSGMSFGAIAAELNDEGVSTVRGGRLWRASSLQHTLRGVGTASTARRVRADLDDLHALFPEEV